MHPPQTIEDLLFDFQRKIVDAIRKEIKDLNCSLPQMELLRHLDENGPVSLSDAAAFLQITKPSASVMIDGMQKRKLATRTIPKNDRRSVLINLTPTSRKLIRTIAEKKKKVIAVLLKKMTAKEKAELSSLLAKLINE